LLFTKHSRVSYGNIRSRKMGFIWRFSKGTLLIRRRLWSFCPVLGIINKLLIFYIPVSFLAIFGLRILSRMLSQDGRLHYFLRPPVVLSEGKIYCQIKENDTRQGREAFYILTLKLKGRRNLNKENNSQKMWWSWASKSVTTTLFNHSQRSYRSHPIPLPKIYLSTLYPPSSMKRLIVWAESPRRF